LFIFVKKSLVTIQKTGPPGISATRLTAKSMIPVSWDHSAWQIRGFPPQSHGWFGFFYTSIILENLK
jgi:hypothetical protein